MYSRFPFPVAIVHTFPFNGKCPDFVCLTKGVHITPPFVLARTASHGAKSGVRVCVNTAAGQGIPNLDLRIGAARSRTGSDGCAFADGAQAPLKVFIEVAVYQLNAGPFELKAPDDEAFFTIHPEAITRVAFNAEKLRVEGDVLELRFFDRSRPMHYHRVGR